MAKLYFRYSAMNAGKSTALLQVAHNYEERGRSVLIFTSDLDDRFGPGIVASRLGLQRNVPTYDAWFDFESTMREQHGVSCVLVDEAQLEEIKTICNCGKKATMNPRVDDEGKRITVGAQIAIEGEVRYAPMCGRCFYDERTRVEPVAFAPVKGAV